MSEEAKKKSEKSEKKRKEKLENVERKISEAEYQELIKKIEELEALKDGMLRTAAEYANVKKRFEKEKSEFLKFANERLIQEFLPVLDHLDRALVHAKTHSDSKESILEGVQIIKKHMCDILKAHGLERLEVLEKPFDPHFHEALTALENLEKEDGTILEEIEGGYLFQGKLLRPSKVVVSKKPEQNDVDIKE